MPEIEGVHHQTLTVRDIQKTVAWYKSLLGFEQVSERTSPEQGWTKIQLYHPASHTRLHFAQHIYGSGDTFSEFRTGLDHLAFRVSGGPAALEAWLSRLEEHDVEHSPIKPTGQGAVITFRDPDNIQLELYAVAES